MACVPVLAGQVWSKLAEEQRRRWTADTWIYPCYQRLPMGLTHSVAILMAINVHHVGCSLLAGVGLTARALREDKSVRHHECGITGHATWN